MYSKRPLDLTLIDDKKSSMQINFAEEFLSSFRYNFLMHLNPGEYIILIFGGAAPAARALGRHRTCPTKWKERGEIPSTSFKHIKAVADKLGLDVTLEDLVYGRTISKTKMLPRKAGTTTSS